MMHAVYIIILYKQGKIFKQVDIYMCMYDVFIYVYIHVTSPIPTHTCTCS